MSAWRRKRLSGRRRTGRARRAAVHRACPHPCTLAATSRTLARSSGDSYRFARLFDRGSLMRQFLCALLLAGGPGFSGIQESTSTAYRALLAVHRCARDYVWGTDARVQPPMRRAHAAYPRDLAELGPHGTRCLDDELSRGAVAGWHIDYHPLLDASGHATGYEVRADESLSSRHAKLRFYSVVHPPEGSPIDPADRNAIVHVRTDGA